MKVPFVDLSLQHEPIRKELNAAIKRVIDSEQYYGEEVTTFEEEWADYCGAEHCVACSSGTSALELALRSCKIGPGDEVIVPANTFIATAEAVTAIGVDVKFVDVDPVTYCITPQTLQQALSSQTKAIIPVHLYGRVAPLEDLRHTIPPRTLLIDDAAQAHGAWIGLDRVGTGLLTDLTCFSFYPTKNLGAMGDAGAAVTNNSVWTAFMRYYRDHGREEHHNHVIRGHNHRMDAIQAAILRVKLPHLDEWNYDRVNLARRYQYNLASCSDVTLPELTPGHAFYLYVVRAGCRDQLRDYLAKFGIGTGLHYPAPLHKTMAYATWECFPVAEQLAKEVLSLPLYPGLTSEQVDYVCETIKEFYNVDR